MRSVSFSDHSTITMACLGEDIFEAQRFEIVEVADAIQIHVIDGNCARIFVDERECGAGDFVLVRGAQAADDSFRERGLPCSQIARQ